MTPFWIYPGLNWKSVFFTQALIFSFDILILVSSLNVLNLFATVAYSLYYLTCFRSLLLFKAEADDREGSHFNSELGESMLRNSNDNYFIQEAEV